jgi:hypothetical protein
MRRESIRAQRKSLSKFGGVQGLPRHSLQIPGAVLVVTLSEIMVGRAQLVPHSLPLGK